MRLTAIAVERAKSKVARYEIPDAASGVRLVVQPSGVKSWAVRYRHAGRTRKLTLGGYPQIGLADARKLAGKALARVAEGFDPAVERAGAQADTVAAIIEMYLPRHVRQHCRPRTITEVERMLGRAVKAWHGRPISSITRRDVIAHLDAVRDGSGPIAANRSKATLSGMFNWAMSRDIISANPAAGVRPPGIERARDRVLSDAELRLVWQAAEQVGFPYGHVVRLLILTGQRRGEVAGMQWGELEDDVWRLPPARTKNGREHVIPLSAQARDIIASIPRIDRSHVFTNGESGAVGYSRGKRAIDALLPLEMAAWTLHDLRRTCASGMARLGLAVHVVEAVLNHKSGAISGVAAIYNRFDYAAEKAHALALWANHVLALVEGRAATNVVAMARA